MCYGIVLQTKGLFYLRSLGWGRGKIWLILPTYFFFCRPLKNIYFLALPHKNMWGGSVKFFPTPSLRILNRIAPLFETLFHVFFLGPPPAFSPDTPLQNWVSTRLFSTLDNKTVCMLQCPGNNILEASTRDRKFDHRPSVNHLFLPIPSWWHWMNIQWT